MKGSIIKEVLLPTKYKKYLKNSQRYVFTSDEAELIELSGYAVIYGLLDKFKPILVLSVNDFEDLISNENIKRSGIYIRDYLIDPKQTC